MDTIIGGSFSTDGVIKLSIDANKIGFIKFAVDGTVIPTVDGTIDSTWGGEDSDCIIYTHRGNTSVDIEVSELTGDIVFDGKSEIIANDCTLLTSLTAPLAGNIGLNGCTSLLSVSAAKTNNISVNGCTSLVLIDAPKSTVTSFTGCTSLTADAVKLILDNAYTLFLRGQLTGTIDGTWATAIDGNSISLVHGISYNAIVDALTFDDAWTIVIEYTA